MIVWSVKVKKKHIWMAAAAAVALLAAVIGIVVQGSRALTAGARMSAAAETEEQRKAFLQGLGWETAEDPVEIRQVTIPDTFNEVYRQYNELQQEQGYDLTPYQGKTVKRWTYEITNYPGAAGERVYADLLICRGKIIGGSIGTRSTCGFMHGLRSVPPVSAPPESGKETTQSGTN